jgi:hypothetical protein
MNSIESMTAHLTTMNGSIRITKNQYDEWKKFWILDALKDYRLGQSFCKYFGISIASPLYHFRDNNISDKWIHDNYLEQ